MEDLIERLNFNQLFYFYVVATEGSIKSACKKLHLTQPTISGQIKTLEEDLGYQLFERKYRKLELSPCGKEIYKTAEKIFILGEELLSAMPNGKSNKKRADIRIGVLSSVPNSLVHDFTLNIWNEQYLSPHLIHGSLNEMLKKMDQDEIDLIIADAPNSQSRKHRSINIKSQKLVAVGTNRFSDARIGFPKSLTGLPYLSFNKNGQTQEEIDYFLKINNILPESIGSVDDDAFIRLAVRKGLCFSILPEQSVRELIQDKSLIKIGELTGISSNCWVISSNLEHRCIQTRKLINSYLSKQHESLT